MKSAFAGRWRLRALPLLLALAFALAAVTAGCGSDGPADEPLRGARVDPAYQKPDAVLTDTRGNPFDIRGQTEGYLTLLFVGYTHCPDVCPTHMHDIAKVLKGLDPSVRENTRVLFITADPERDTPEALGEWLAFFDPTFIGLTGTRDEIGDLLGQLGMEHGAHHPLGEGNYIVEHAAYVIAFEHDNVGRLVYPLGVTLEDWAHDLPILAKAKKG